jgi:hypothetical protein
LPAVRKPSRGARTSTSTHDDHLEDSIGLHGAARRVPELSEAPIYGASVAVPTAIYVGRTP